jgi:serine/threonine protein kinase
MRPHALHGDSGRFSSGRLPSSLTLPTQARAATRVSDRKQPTFAQQTIDYKPVRVIGQGAFGIVYCARCSDGSLVAIKKVRVDPRFKNRELEVLREVNNRYVIRLLNYFRSSMKQVKDVYLNLVMEYMPESLHQFTIGYRKERKYPPLLYVKLYAYQMFAGLEYLHSLGITHRDLKPQNMLVDRVTGELKICDLGSAKRLLPNEASVSYIASRYYRAPELMFDCVYYTSAIDIWAAGCCIAEMLLSGMPIFIGESSMGQLNAIASLLGPPTDEELDTFPHNANIELLAEKRKSLTDVLPRHTPPDLIDLLRQIFVYSPGQRPTARECMNHCTFDELFELDIGMPSGKPLPVLESRDV